MYMVTEEVAAGSYRYGLADPFAEPPAPVQPLNCNDSRYRPQFDHITPKGKGGETTVANLRVLCQRHDLIAARQAFGEKLMRRYGRAGDVRTRAG